MKKGFTLIELLIVVAIIAILAAIAVPNFLEAQVRSKVSRAKADMRSLATAIESYATQENHYPPAEVVVDDGFAHHVMQIWKLTTPVAYISGGASYKDPLKKGTTYLDHRSFYYEYMNREYYYLHGNPAGGEWFVKTYGEWRLVCAGPDGWVFNGTIQGRDGMPAFTTTSYDPTNGTVSVGDIYRTSKDPDLKKPI
ncbi:MAG TPA: prepilin-type N-terminal cleavage/methylation domain-containing protein [Candidatus Sumerlaeota bacterium]|nr:MAG: Type II secretion system protein G precursor [candidate division BRC1 bacterium ADurb.Bin183]HOE63279.1 prepilin-type N-terminal cleavage/methylation domain-containing protein [Candidatus Sumerlaeota bacterium]HRR29867.1 prepilin-type N-terminal cleavage/methylation domain-containing protein [Candidatus Sumerlaeia bacterium]HON50637.1 prepilin-type N-terminal cleavage/methylation domain-containing protein [Candidatus Sumerlaeota bacterium]HOR65459.1 prepilin-type N-terminal cleavage/met